MKMIKLLALLSLTFGATAATATTYYVSPTGNDANSGTQASPWRTIQKGVNTVVAGDTCFVRAGTYSISTEVSIVSKSGTATSPITLKNFPGEKPVIDAIGMTNNGNADIRLGKPIKLISSNWWVIEGFEVKNGPAGGVILNR